MVTTRQQALEIAARVRQGLEEIYNERLRGVYLYGSAARDQLTTDSDSDIAVVLDEIPSRFADGTFLVYRTIKREGIPV